MSRVLAKIRAQDSPRILGVTETREENRLEASDRMGCRKQILAELARFDNGLFNVRESHDRSLQATANEAEFTGLTARCGDTVRFQLSKLALSPLAVIAQAPHV